MGVTDGRQHRLLHRWHGFENELNGFERMRKKHNSGSALVFILIAIALLGGLTVMLSRTSTSTEETGSSEKDIIIASSIFKQGAFFKAAIDRLILSGCSVNEIDMSSEDILPGWNWPVYGAAYGYANPSAPANKRCHLFHPSGGGVSLADNMPPIPGTKYIFSGQARILGLGDPNKFEIIAWVATPSKSLCQKVNQMAGINYVNNEPWLYAGGGYPNDYLGVFPDQIGGWQQPPYGGVEATGKKAVCIYFSAWPDYRIFYVLYVR